MLSTKEIEEKFETWLKDNRIPPWALIDRDAYLDCWFAAFMCGQQNPDNAMDIKQDPWVYKTAKNGDFYALLELSVAFRSYIMDKAPSVESWQFLDDAERDKAIETLQAYLNGLRKFEIQRRAAREKDETGA